LKFPFSVSNSTSLNATEQKNNLGIDSLMGICISLGLKAKLID